MLEILYVLQFIVTSLLGGYTGAFQAATLHWGKTLAPHQQGTGFQDALTPPFQTTRNLCYFALLLGVLILGIALFGWLFGILGFLGVFFLTTPLVKVLLPKPDSHFFRSQILRGLARKRVQLQSRGDELRVQAVDFLLTRFADFE